MKAMCSFHLPERRTDGTKFFCKKTECKRASRLPNDESDDSDDDDNEEYDEDSEEKENILYECANCKIRSATFDPFIRVTHSLEQTNYFCKKVACIRASGLS